MTSSPTNVYLDFYFSVVLQLVLKIMNDNERTKAPVGGGEELYDH
jgi:hypothetical protein